MLAYCELTSKRYRYACLFRYIGRSRSGGVGMISRSPIPPGICEEKCCIHKSSTTSPFGKYKSWIRTWNASGLNIICYLKTTFDLPFSYNHTTLPNFRVSSFAQKTLCARSVWGGHVINLIKWLIVITSIRPCGINWWYTHSPAFSSFVWQKLSKWM